MALNNGGVGVVFFADDKGLFDHVEKLSKAMGGLSDKMGPGLKDDSDSAGKSSGKLAGMVGTIDTAFGGLFGTLSKTKAGFMSAFVPIKVLLGPIGGMLVGLGEAMLGFVKALPGPQAIMNSFKGLSDVRELTSSLEAEFVGLSTETRRLAANMGYTGKELDRVTNKSASTAMAMNVGADEAMKAARAWDEAGDSLKAMGFKSEKQLIKFTSAFGVNADSLRNAGLRMQKEFGLTADEINKVVGSTFAMGKATGDVAAGMETLPAVMDRMRDQASMMGKELDGAKLANFAASTNALAAGLFDLDQNADQAVTAAAELSQALLDADRNFKNMFAGTQNELDDFTKEMAITTGDVEQAFKLMKQGPAGFVSGMAEMVAAAKKNKTFTNQSLTFIGARLEKVLGKDASARLVNFFRRSDEGAIRAMASTQNATAELGKMGEQAFRTGRTMAEVFERAQESMTDTFRKAGKKDVNAWVKNTMAGMKKAGKAMLELGKKDGPMGDFVRQLSLAQHIGASAFLPASMQSAGVILGTFSEKLGPTIEMMSQMGLNLTSLSGILTTAAAGAGLFAAAVVQNKKDSESWGSAIKRTAGIIADDMVKSIDKWGGVLKTIASEFAKFDWASLFDGAGEAVSDKKSGPIGKIISAFKNIPWTEEVLPNLMKGWEKLWKGVESTGLIDKVRDTMGTVMDEVIKPMFSEMGTFLLEAIEKVPWGKIGGAIAKGVGSAAFDALNPFGGQENMAKFIAINEARREASRGKRGRGRSKAGERAARKVAEGFVFDPNAHKLERSHDMLAGLTTESHKMGEALVSDFRMGEIAVDSLMSHVEDATTNSIHTLVGADMDKTVDVMTTALEKIENMFVDAWARIGEGAVLAMGIIDASGIMRKLELLTQAQDELATLKRGAPPITQSDTARDMKIREATGDRAVHNPEWYGGSRGFEELFTRKMDRLIAAVAAGGSGGTTDVGELRALAAELRGLRRGGGGPGARRGTGTVKQPSTDRSGRKR